MQLKKLAQTIAKNTVATLIGVVLTVLLLEGGIRVLADSLGLSPYMKYHATLGWTARPGAVKQHKNSSDEFDVTYVINQRGFRGPEYPIARAPGRHRIVVLGDSTGFGWGVAEDQTFSSIIDREIPDTEVINLSLSGFGTDQSYLRFVEEGLAFRPDLVILQISPNDFEEIQFAFFNQKAKPYYELDDAGDLLLRNVPVKPVGPKAREFQDDSLPLPFGEWLGWNSFAYNFLNEKYHRLRRRRQVQPAVKTEIYSTGRVRLFNRIALELKHRLDEIGAEGVLVTSGKEISERHLIADTHLRVLDLYPAFARASNDNVAAMYFSDGYHWNPAGHRLVADELKKLLSAQARPGQGG